ncbi:hypothetical protein PsYK624_118530 [Phanerochaete sordida]|uniref:Uncharacterized protein n=1 Tax=Phanerochaete sordida TaxID=48140 RepID=A0A9P3LIY6_9APHY|nr:hypothetical protein PsYK624_118530 [Phanerochaete sordida]
MFNLLFRRKTKVARHSTLPPELVLSIVSSTLARFIDDLIRGPSSRSRDPRKELASDPPDGGPVQALLIVSYQVRQATLEILSGALDVPVVKEGIWRLRRKPFTVIASVRKMWATPFRDGEPGRRDIVENLGECTGMSAVLHVYWSMCAIDALDYDWLHPGPGSDGDWYAIDSLGPHVQDIATVKASMARAYLACPPEFKDVVLSQMERCLAGHTTLTLLYMPSRAATEFWSMRRFTPQIPDTQSDLLIRIIKILRQVQLSGEKLLDDWPYATISFQAATRSDLLDSWPGLLESICADTGDWQELHELQKVAGELRERFIGVLQARLRYVTRDGRVLYRTNIVWKRR